MESNYKPMYLFDAADSKSLLHRYFSQETEYSYYKETTFNLMKSIIKTFKDLKIPGETLTDFSIGPIISHFLPMVDCVKKITVLEVSDASVDEIQRWKDKHPGAFNWIPTIELYKDLSGNSDECKTIEENVRGMVEEVCVWDPEKEDDSLQLSQTDIGTSIWGVESISKDPKDFKRKLKRYCKFIKPGGYLLFYAALHCSYFEVGDVLFHYLPCEESFFRKAICEEDFEIEHCETFARPGSSPGADHKGMVYIIAHKKTKP